MNDSTSEMFRLYGSLRIINSSPISISDSDSIVDVNLDQTFEEDGPSSSGINESMNWTCERFKNMTKCKTPSSTERVMHWMGNNSMLNSSETVEVDTDDVEDTNEYIFLKRDFQKDEKSNRVENRNEFNLKNVLCTSPKSPVNDAVSSVEENSESACLVSLENYENLDESVTHPIPKNGDVQFSPSVESRKKELYNYLKLMNPADKKEVSYSQFRRSNRVKNLELKELARKNKLTVILNDFNKRVEQDVESDKILGITESSCDIEESITLQSFNDLNMTVDTSKYPTLQNNECCRKIFNFVMPPSDVLEEFNDFELWIDPLVKKMNKKRIGMYPKENGKIENGRGGEHRESEEEEEEVDIPIETNSPVLGPARYCRDKPTSTKKRKRNGSIEVDSSVTSVKNDEEDTQRLLLKRLNGERQDGLEEKVDDMNHVIRIDYRPFKKRDLQKKSPNHSETDLSSVHRTIQKGETYDFIGFDEGQIAMSREIRLKFEKCLSESAFAFRSLSSQINRNFNVIHKNEEGKIEDACHSFSDKDVDESLSETSDSDSLSSVESEDGSSSASEIERYSLKSDKVNTSSIKARTSKTIPFNDVVDTKTLHSFLKKRVKINQRLSAMNLPDWDSDSSMCDKQKNGTSRGSSHFISFKEENGAVQSCIYVDYYLILIQEFSVSLWNQTALGNVLGAQNLWIFNGFTKKLILNKECVRKKSLEMAISTESCVVYVEIWTKEHKSDIRQGPVADVFATVYYWIQKSNRMDRKVLQLENINGFADDVQYVVLRSSLNIVVSWHSGMESNKTTQICIYTLAEDFQTIGNVRALAKVEHYVSSLHNIEDCEELLMGCGEHTITLWNIEHGYVVATIELSDIKLSLYTLWVKCDRGILFTLQQCVDGELRLIAINGRNHSWKKLKSYKPPDGFERIKNVYIENGVLISFYEEGILCWKAQTGEQILEENHNETDVEYFPSGKYLVILTKKKVFIRHALTHLLAVDD